MKGGGRGVRGANQSLSVLDAPFDDTVPLNDILSTTTTTDTGQQSQAQHHRSSPRRRLQAMFSSSAGGGSDSNPNPSINSISPYAPVEGQTISAPELINDASDTAPIVDSDEGRSFESDATNPTVQVPPSKPINTHRAYISVGILFAINLLNYMDRYTIAGVLHSVQDFYGINNTKLGLLQTAFIVSYMLFSPIFGYVGDRFNRKYIMACGIFFWSCLTLAGSFVGKDRFTLFLFLRALVGIGEATYSTIAPTIIADLFVKDMRSRMLMVFYFAIPVGSGLGYIVGSNVASAVGKWQYALRVTPPLGICCTVLILVFLVEPERGSSEGGTHLKNTSYLTDVKSLLKIKSFVFSTIGFMCVAFVTGALALWAPYFMYDAIRLLDGSAEMADVSLKFGIITCAAGFIGVAVGSVSAQYYRRINPRADPLICANGMLLCTPFIFFTLITMQYSITASWILIFIGETLLCLNWAIVADILLYVVIPTRRSLAESFQIIISHMFGDAGSPYLIGLISDKLSLTYPEYMRGTDFLQFITLRAALYITCFMCVLGGGAFFAAALFVEKDKERVDNVLRDLIKNASKSNGVGPHVNKAYSIEEGVTAGAGPNTVENGNKGIGGAAEEKEPACGREDDDDDGDEEGIVAATSRAGSAAASLKSIDGHHFGSLECREMERMQSLDDTSCHDNNNEYMKEREEEEEGDKKEVVVAAKISQSPPSSPPPPPPSSPPPPPPSSPPPSSPPPPPPSSPPPSSPPPPPPSSSPPPPPPPSSPPPSTGSSLPRRPTASPPPPPPDTSSSPPRPSCSPPTRPKVSPPTPPPNC